jgi:hypothetical protein
MIAALLIACTPLPTCTVPVTVSPCATPTPCFQWNPVADADLAGYKVYVDGVLLVTLPCEWFDADENGIPDTRFCRGADAPIPLQRYCPACQPFFSYTVTVKAYDTANNESLLFSNPDSACMSPICVAPGPCS